ncbi:hypothetical protein BCR32DRAFT_280862 [Anaeromyces robustus]|uniref:Ankyrin n=1 Tax=Anaeromyces robustus TaxID=1754192 RepID=A0A1Y1X2S5_9FUNG|nr:hypothetical protein BCR32DRAFT_280862 [Anaeromyces robustus]|eukprot:ORX80083.1 hypothetical protein BCR32DRAFT_280862 [Anaeromyces robustus]
MQFLVLLFRTITIHFTFTFRSNKFVKNGSRKQASYMNISYQRNFKLQIRILIFFLNKGLDIKKILFILNIKGDANLISNNVLCHITELKNASIEENNDDGKNVIEYLIDNKLLDIKKLLFILNIKGDAKTYKYPLLSAVKNNNIIIVKLLMKYAKENNTILRINDKDNNGDFSLLFAVKNDNKGSDYTSMVELLMQYANENNIVLNIND